MNIVKKLKHIIRWFTPYGMVRWYASNRKKQNSNDVEDNPYVYTSDDCFMYGFRKYITGLDSVQFTDKSPFDVVVAVQGFGFSGSGAVVDLFREYDSTFVIGSVDYEGSLAIRDRHCEEVDILRLAGGLFEVERFLGSNNIFQNDALLHRIVAQIEYSDLYKSLPAVRPYFYEYFRQVCRVLTNSPENQYYNQFLDYKENKDILYLNDITLSEYRGLCQKLLNSIFKIIKGDSSKSILVLDQFVGDVEFDMDRYLDYIPNLKIITVYRDPRDVYTFANKNNVEWIPHTTADIFIDWFKTITKRYNVNEQDKYQVIQFERLINHYDEVVYSVEKYIGLNADEHVRKCSCLDVNVSRKNTYLWKQCEGRSNAFDLIYKQLHLYCYNNK